MSRLAPFCAALLCLALPACGAPERELQWRVMERYPQSREHFVQGLEFAGENLYISSGGYGRSRLSRYRFPSGELLAQHRLPEHLFAEGLTVFRGELYQLTWRARRVLVYDAQALQPRRELRIDSEGWGLTHNGSHLIYSDGSEMLRFLDAHSGDVLRRIEVRLGTTPVTRLNELEWIDGHIWANVWQSDRIVVIDPGDGTVTATLDLSGLLPPREQRADTGVLNGIARDPRGEGVWVSGKRWPWMYRLQIENPH